MRTAFEAGSSWACSRPAISCNCAQLVAGRGWSARERYGTTDRRRARIGGSLSLNWCVRWSRRFLRSRGTASAAARSLPWRATSVQSLPQVPGARSPDGDVGVRRRHLPRPARKAFRHWSSAPGGIDACMRPASRTRTWRATRSRLDRDWPPARRCRTVARRCIAC